MMIGRYSFAVRAAVAVGVMVSVLAGPALAQTKAPAAKGAPPAAAPPAAAAPAPKAAAPAPGVPAATSTPSDAQKSSAWVKLCESIDIPLKDKTGKDYVEKKALCETRSERWDGNAGVPLIFAAVRQTVGANSDALVIMVPLGAWLPAGMKAVFHNKEQWAKAAKGEKIDEKQVKIMDLKFLICVSMGCTAEAPITKEFEEAMHGGGGVIVLAGNAQGQTIGIPVELTGFDVAFDGAPVDSKIYAQARTQMMTAIAERRKQLIEEYRKQAEAAAQAGGGAAAPAPGGAPAAAPPAAAPRAKK